MFNLARDHGFPEDLFASDCGFHVETFIACCSILRQSAVDNTERIRKKRDLSVAHIITLDGCGSNQIYFHQLLRIALDIPTPGTHAHSVSPSLRASLAQFLRPAQHANFTWPDDAEEPSEPGPDDQQLYARPAYSHVQHGQLFAIESNKMRTAFTTYVAFNVQDHIEQIIKHCLQHHHNLTLMPNNESS
ncbi:hypothetical protein DFS34DRAFT_282358 [Phlyctochytrium arcticum]|nr:hypothetical protein DFS34DRAFT_282358 [Phlyctochytrium arcticum]